MAITNSIELNASLLSSGCAQAAFDALQHEKKSCSLAAFSALQLLAVNGHSVRIHYKCSQSLLDYIETGLVVSVLVPSSNSSDMGILFRPDNGDDLYFPDPTKTDLLEVLN